MKIRVVQIWGFLMTVLGWIFVACTMAMEGWKIASVGGMGGSSIIKVAWYWASLWRSCFTDSTAVSNCYDFPMLWSVEGPIQIVRGLLMGALSVGMLGFILSLLGMECTHIGGKDKSKYRKIYAGGCCHIISGALSTSGYAVYAQYVSAENFASSPVDLKYDLGTSLFLGWVGSAFHMAGGFFHLWSVCKPLCGRNETVITVRAQLDPEQNEPTKAPTDESEKTSKTKMSSISELSSRSERSDVSSILSKTTRTSQYGRTARSGRASTTGRTSVGSSRSGSESGSGSQSSMSSRSSLSTLSESRSSSRSSRSSRTVSSLSGSLINETTPFVRNTYI
ncbi:claudin-10 [Kryptolebias marmoratus]|uniref:Claudin 10e n=1 Tax=Kryptolebias marmoratus TaxID=37003 RepID=A0A3Q3A6K0_KRYMA|nr:claudin-10 [Kryptolebias marmoratus]